jgi:hypothetical protein
MYLHASSRAELVCGAASKVERHPSMALPKNKQAKQEWREGSIQQKSETQAAAV